MKYSYYLIHRSLFSILVLLGLSIMIFLIARVIPGDPARLALGPLATHDMVENLRKKMHLDEPLHIQYYYFIKGLFQGDLGESLYTRRPVTKDLREFFPATFELVAFSGFLMILIGVPLGVLSAKYKDSWIDNTVRIISFAGVITPSFVWAIILMLIFSYLLGVLPVMGRLSPDLSPPPVVTGFITIDSLLAGDFRKLLDFLHHLILPAVSLSLAGMAQTARMTRANLIDVAGRDYILAARAFGLPEYVLAFKYMLKPSLIPTITVLGLDFAALLGNAFLVELVFNWPGMSRYGVQAILRKDLNAIVGVTMVTGLLFVTVNFIIDVIVGYLDPRIRLKESRA